MAVELALFLESHAHSDVVTCHASPTTSLEAAAAHTAQCVNCRGSSAGSILSPQMAQFQGPALLAYNDGVFSEKDFESISRIGDSKKREQIGKTGRFG